MGGGVDIDRKNGGFLTYKYESNEMIGGVKVVEKKTEYKTGRDEPPPPHSGKSEMYFGMDRNGRIDTLKIYQDRNSRIEIHTHREKSGNHINPEGTPHFHVYKVIRENGKVVGVKRVDRAMKLTTYLINKYGALLEMARQRNIAHGFNDPPLNYNSFVEKPKPKRKP